MNTSISDQIQQLPNMTKAELLSIWTKHFHQPPPPKLQRQLMTSILAYRIQEREYGGLSNTAKKRLREIASSLPAGKIRIQKKSSDPNQGTRLVRTWKGEVHEVFVWNGSFTYRGKEFSNLSQIAREITGTRWSGPLFFGTKERKK
ncbi:MAG: DUF2924 domain-containing protein [Acidobacteriaceae bacterium]